MYRPRPGSIQLDGASITGLKPSGIAQIGLGRTFQTSQLFRGMTVLENMMTGLHRQTVTGFLGAGFCLHRAARRRKCVRRRRRAAHLHFVGMSEFADRPGDALSFGQQRMVEIARTLISDPKIVLLDEPAVGLSINRVDRARRALAPDPRQKGVTLVLIEHVIRLVMDVSDRVTVLSSGRGSPMEPGQQCATIRR